jgi:putative DeoR family transcriptional regulator (stage III sporulation protein D)
MRDRIEQRVKKIASYITSTEATVRQAAKVFGVSKSTVHRDMTKLLPDIDIILFQRVKKILDKNKEERHLRGGKATKEYWEKRKQNKGG